MADTRHSTYISAHLAQFRRTGNPLHLARAARLILRQGRVPELLFGLWCGLRHRPARMQPATPDPMPRLRAEAHARLVGEDCWTREDLVARFGADHAVHELPPGFEAARREAIVAGDDFLALGEYGEGRKRIAFLRAGRCSVLDHYERDVRVRHIHALHEGPEPGQLMVTTGDQAKYLDVWDIRGDTPVFSTRLRRRLAGHTAIARIDGRHLLGSDMSSRLNYLETLDGRRMFFPRPVSRMYVVAFLVRDDRYLLSLHKDLSVFSDRHALSVYDTKASAFVGCEILPVPAQRPRPPLPLRGDTAQAPGRGAAGQDAAK